MENCIFCNKHIANGEAIFKLGEKGCFTINRVGTEKYVNIFAVPNQRFHTDCSRDDINPNFTIWIKKEKEHFFQSSSFNFITNLYLVKIACFVVIGQKIANKRELEDMKLFVLELGFSVFFNCNLQTTQ